MIASQELKVSVCGDAIPKAWTFPMDRKEVCKTVTGLCFDHF